MTPPPDPALESAIHQSPFGASAIPSGKSSRPPVRATVWAPVPGSMRTMSFENWFTTRIEPSVSTAIECGPEMSPASETDHWSRNTIAVF